MPFTKNCETRECSFHQKCIKIKVISSHIPILPGFWHMTRFPLNRQHYKASVLFGAILIIRIYNSFDIKELQDHQMIKDYRSIHSTVTNIITISPTKGNQGKR